MSEVRIKIKELATELEVQPKDVLEAVRQFGMAAKSVQGSVSADEASRLRNHFEGLKQPSAPAKPSVIVRRRRKDADTPAPQEAPKAAPVEAAEPAAKAEEEAPVATATVSAPVAEETEAAPTAKAVEPKTAPTSEPANTPEPEAASSDSPSASSEAVAAPASETPAVAEEEAEADSAARPARKREVKQPVAAPAARVISRPVEEKPEETTPPPAAEPKVKKRSEVLEAITAKTEDEAPAREKAPQEAAPAAAAENQRRAMPRPDASAVPEGSSAPSLPIRPARPRDDSEAESDDAAQSAPQDAAPKVRIISRPTAPATPRPQPGDRRGGRDGAREGGRDGGRPGRPGQGDGNFRERSGGGFRQQQAPAEPMPDSRDGQSKKKRNKGRRTVDFQAGDVFGRHEEDVTQMNRQRGKRKPGRQQPVSAPSTQPVKAAKRKIRFAEAITVADMAKQMGLKANELIKVLFGMGVMATINQSLDMDTATLLASEFEYEVEKTGFSEDEFLLPKEADTPESLKPRPPVVTIMGHVDHGKTSLLDAIRKSHVTSGEAGGITQHIGAYHVKTKRGNIVFLDTPGHEAFTAMRARGAQITDLVILVVAADDGVMEQTREAVNHSRAAGVPIMVAVNKMDKPGANPDRVLRELAEMGLQPEDWGGDTIVAKVSAKTREGLDDLLEMVALQSEIMELKANPDKPARGHIVEARLDKGRGAVATVLIQEGTLRHGDNFVCGTHAGRVRALLNDQGKKAKDAGPSIPVEVQGFDGVPEAGEEFVVVADDKVARRIADTRAAKQRERALAAESRVTLESFLSSRADDAEAVPLNLVLKADVQGSLEAITEAVNKLSTPKVQVHVVHGGTGAISESDIMLASASKAIIIGFNVRPTAKVKEVAEHENVDIRYYDIIYKLVEDMQSAMAGLLAPVQREVYLGQAEVRQTYNVPKVGLIAGCFVADGKIVRNAGVRLLRDGVVVYTGKIASLKRFKDDAKEVAKGNECGAGLENFNDVKVGDILEAFETVEEAATL